MSVVGIASAEQVHWDGEAGDGLWSSSKNWSVDRLPKLGDDVVIKDADVTWDNALENGNLLADSLRLDGKAHLKVASVIRFNHAQVHIGPEAKVTNQVAHVYLDWLGARVTIESGATLEGSLVWEHKSQPKFAFKLDSKGFKTLRPQTICVRSQQANQETRFSVDIQDYEGPEQKLVLVQFDRCNMEQYEPWLSPDNAEVLNPGPYHGSRIEWDAETHSLVLHILKNHSFKKPGRESDFFRIGNLTIKQRFAK